jgi:hypothetical protein
VNIFSFSNSIRLVAQQNGLGNEAAKIVLDSSINLTKNTAQSWDRIWELTVNPAEPLWQALVEIGAFIAAASIIYLAIKEGNRLVDNPTWQRLITMMQFPLAIAILFGGNGIFLVGIIKYVRAVAYFWLNKILEMTFAGVSVSEALQKIQNTSVADARAREIFADCIDKTGLDLQDCLSDPIKLQQASDMLQTLSGADGLSTPLDGNLLAQAGNFVESGLTAIVVNPFVELTTTLLIALQWAFINAIEASLILTALFAPIALGLSMIPSAGPTIFAWFSGYLSLFLMQLGYVILVGFTALILSLTEQAGQPLGSTIVDLGFLMFLSIIAPVIAIAIANGGGRAVFNGISRGAVTAITTAASAGASAANFAAINALKKS